MAHTASETTGWPRRLVGDRVMHDAPTVSCSTARATYLWQPGGTRLWQQEPPTNNSTQPRCAAWNTGLRVRLQDHGVRGMAVSRVETASGWLWKQPPRRSRPPSP